MIFQSALTPEGHEHCVEHGARVVEQVRELRIAAHLAQVPEVTAHVDITQRAHVELPATVAHLRGQLVGMHGEQAVQEDQQAHQRSWQ